MNKNIWAVLIFIVTLFIILLNFNIINQDKIEPVMAFEDEMIFVDDSNINGPWKGTQEHPFQDIEDAINRAEDLDKIFVRDGIYNGSFKIDKQITITGESRNNTCIDGHYENVVVLVTVDNVIFENFTIRNSGGYMDNAGIKIKSKNNKIKNCNIYRTKTGIYLDESENNNINNCSFHTNGEGIFLKSSTNIIINNCYFAHNAIGINIKESSRTITSNSYAHTNGIGFFCTDSSDIEFIHCASYNNNDNQKGMFLERCTSTDIVNCNIYHNGVGIHMKQSSDIFVNQCDINWNTHYAVIVGDYSKNVIISYCNVLYNFRYAIGVEVDSYSDINENNIYKNILYGVESENRNINAKNNWWGSIFGPSYTELGLGDRITRKRTVRYFPWKLSLLKNAGSDWNHEDICTDTYTSYGRFSKIEIEGNDSDEDGIPDWWEEKYGYDPHSWDNHEKLDPDEDGLNNIEECYTDQWGSDPFFKDIFLEFDWMISRYSSIYSNKPSITQFEEAKSIFLDHDINLHIDTGNLGGGEEIPYKSSFSYADLRDMYWNYFLHNDLNNPRKGIFHYALVCDYGPGPGFAFVGWDHLDSFDISAQWLQKNQPDYDKGRLILGGSIHELGHTLGLFVDDHGGNDNMGATKLFSRQWFKYRNYKSCMNYLHTYNIIGYSDGSHGRGDFDDWSNLDFYFFKDTHFEWPKN